MKSRFSTVDITVVIRELLRLAFFNTLFDMVFQFVNNKHSFHNHSKVTNIVDIL